MLDNPLAAGLGLAREPPPLTLVIFGASGDLTRRKLIPALFSLFRKGHVPGLKIVGFARRDWDTDMFRGMIREMLAPEEGDKAGLVDAFLGGVSFVRSSESADSFRALGENIGGARARLFYLAIPPDSYEPTLGLIHETGIADQGRGACSIVIEKPLGRDLASAGRLGDRIASVFPENRIFRIDHYLGKETVRNIMLFRFGNQIFEPVWNNHYVHHVQITMAETLGVGSRGRYYESAGALRDMVQNHMLQLLCLVAMEPPVDQDPDSIRDEKLKVLKSIKPIGKGEVGTETVRAQYGRGVVGGESVPAYREEEGVDPASGIETYAAVRLHLDSWRWAGVPFVLRTGKRLSRRTTEISIHFTRPPLSLFGDREADPPPPNALVFRIQPQEGITVSFNTKIPGYASDMRAVNMDFSYGSAFGDELPEAYERLLLDAMVGDSTLFMRKDEVDAAWRLVTGILDGWSADGAPALSFYRAGSSGPESAAGLPAGGERKWRRL
jgi:glucose-6-phosphate 1-dehydrogenase